MQQSQIGRPSDGAGQEHGEWQGWFFDLTVGASIGAIVGAIAAVNIVIFGGIDRGYEAGLSEVFEQNPLVGGLAAIAFATGTIGGVVIMRRQRAALRSFSGSLRGPSALRGSPSSNDDEVDREQLPATNDEGRS